MTDRASLAAAWETLGRRECILEGLVDFACETSVIVARGLDGEARCFPIGLNDHRDGILRTTTVPSGLSAEVQATAERFGLALARGLDLVGLVALEMFVTRDGRVLANEMAPRPHNSGHWTMDACATSQFEQLVRAICGLPLGPVEVLAPSCMENLIGDEAGGWPRYLADPTARLHLYGKGGGAPRPQDGPCDLSAALNGRSRGRAGPGLHPSLQLLDLHDVVDAPVEEAPGGLAARRAVVQPVEQGRGIDAGQVARLV